MITYIGDVDWTRKVKQHVPKKLRQDVTIIQLDRADNGEYSSSQSVSEALRVANTNENLIVLVGSCPEQDYKANNRQIWHLLPSNRTFFFDASTGNKEFSKLLRSIGRR